MNSDDEKTKRAEAELTLRTMTNIKENVLLSLCEAMGVPYADTNLDDLRYTAECLQRAVKAKWGVELDVSPYDTKGLRLAVRDMAEKLGMSRGTKNEN